VTELGPLLSWLREHYDAEPKPPLRVHASRIADGSYNYRSSRDEVSGDPIGGERTADFAPEGALGAPPFSPQFEAWIERFNRKHRSDWYPCASVLREEEVDCRHPGYPKANHCPYCAGSGSKRVLRQVYLWPMAAALHRLQLADERDERRVGPHWHKPYEPTIRVLVRTNYDVPWTASLLGFASYLSGEAHVAAALGKLQRLYSVAPIQPYRPRDLSESQAIAEAAA
jgi:hypothetical protein